MIDNCSLTPTEIDHLSWLEDTACRVASSIGAFKKSLERDVRWGILGLDHEEQLQALREDVAITRREYAALVAEDAGAFERHLLLLHSELRDKEAHLKRMERPIVKQFKTDGPDAVTPERIDRARQYPIHQLLGVKEGSYAECPHCHEGRLWTKKGYGWCFACNKRCTSLDYLVNVRGVGFVDAVKQLA